jgi:hypothetical protein
MIILAPDPTLQATIVATAWRVQLPLPDAADPRLVDFVERYQLGPYTPDPGPACSGGVGRPVS